MARNRRNTRRRNKIKEFLTWRNFWIIAGILIAIILICFVVNTYRTYKEKKIITEQQEEIERQSEEIFSQITTNIEETNKNISESDSIIKLSAVGDILCSNEMLEDAYDEEEDTYDFSYMFENITDFLGNSDIVMGTMETGITNGTYNDKNAPIEFAEAVKQSGVNLVTVAHNHSLDNGVDGLEKTKENLEKLGFDVVGDKNDEDNAVVIKEVKESKIAFLTYTCFLDNQDELSDDELSAVNIYSEKQVKNDISYAQENGAEYICVMIHWGDAISDEVNDEQKEIADFLVESGANIIIGAHPSVVQPMEIKENADGENVLVAYSIGTYISTLSSEEAHTELVLNIELRKSGKDGKIYLNKVDYTPIYMLDNGEGEEKRFELIDMKEVATSYKGDGTDAITKETYDELVDGLNKLNKILETSGE